MHCRALFSTLLIGIVWGTAGCGADGPGPAGPIDSGRVDGDGGTLPAYDAAVPPYDAGPGYDAGDVDAGPPPPPRTGQTQGSAIALTPDNAIAVAANRTANTISVVHVDFLAASPITSMTTLDVAGAEPWMVVTSNDSDSAYVVLRAARQVVKVQGLRVAPTLAATRASTGSEPTGIAISPTGRQVYVANWAEGTVSVIDTGSMAVVYTIDLNGPLAASGSLGAVSARPGLAHPRALVVTNDGDTDDADETLWVTEYFSQARSSGVPSGDAQFDEGREGIVYRVPTAGFTVGALVRIAPVSDTTFVDSRGATTGCFPNQLQTAAIAGNRLYIGALCESPRGPTGPVIDPMTGAASNTANFKTQIHTSIFAVDLSTAAEVPAERVLLTSKFQQRYDAAMRPDDGASRRMPLIATDLAFVPASRIGYVTGYGSDAVFRVRYNDDGSLNEVGSPLADFINLSSTAMGAPPAGRLPIGIAISATSPHAIVLNENTRNVSVISFATQSVSTAVDVATQPAAGSPEAHRNTGRRFFVTGLGRWSFKGQAWNSCESCHGDGLTDNVTWFFARGPRQSTSLDGTYDSTDPTQMRLLNWTAIFDEVHDFELNTRGNSGGVGAIVHATSTPAAAADRIHFDGSSPVPAGQMATATPQAGLNGSTRGLMPTSGAPIVSRIADWDEIDLYIQSIRSPAGPVGLNAADVAAGRALFESNNCASCHGTRMFTISRRFFVPNESNNNPTSGLLRSANYTAPAMFPPALNPPSMGAGRTASLRFPAGMTAAANDQIQCILRQVGTFGRVPAGLVPISEVRADMTTAAQGASGFNPPSLLDGVAGAPYFHAGGARTLEEVFDPAFEEHYAALSVNFLVTGDRATQVRQIVAYLLSIDETTVAPAEPSLGFDTRLCPTTF